jgi:hypothetical protein
MLPLSLWVRIRGELQPLARLKDPRLNELATDPLSLLRQKWFPLKPALTPNADIVLS